MSQVVKFPADEEAIRREAALWVARIEQGDLNQDEQQSLNEWVSRSPLHRNTLTRLAKVWDRMSDAGESLQEYAEQSSIKTKDQTSSLWTQHFYKVAAVFALVLLIPLVMYFGNSTQQAATHDQYTTTVGQQRKITLGDGSEILLNTDSKVDIAYTPEKRMLRLVRGEAIFDVAQDKTRPFIVQTDSGDVQALGTSFAVRVDEDVVKVLVSHGTVRVRSSEAVQPVSKPMLSQQETIAEVVVTAGDNVVFDKERVESVVRESEDTVARKLYWRNGFLAFNDEPLADVVREVIRYTQLDIVIDDEALKSLRVGGYYPIDNLESVFTSLELNLGLSVEKKGDKYFIKQA